MLLLLILTADYMHLGLQTELRRMDEEMKENLLVKGVLMESLIVSLTEAQNQIPQIKPRDKWVRMPMDKQDSISRVITT